MSREAAERSARDPLPGLKGAGSGTSNPEAMRPEASSHLYMEHPLVKRRGTP